jgi:hypothetical protein
LDEGVEVFRPTTATSIGGGIYLLNASPDYDESIETWEFPPGSHVRCKEKAFDGEIEYVAFESIFSIKGGGDI